MQHRFQGRGDEVGGVLRLAPAPRCLRDDTGDMAAVEKLDRIRFASHAAEQFRVGGYCAHTSSWSEPAAV
jgi:hypothetical protein